MNSNQIDLSKYEVRTDLAIERHQLATNSDGTKIPGVRIDEQNIKDVQITRIFIESEAGSKALNKPPGYYLTFEAKTLRNHDSKVHDQVTNIFASEFQHYLKKLDISKDAKVLIIGLGNWNVTPDALGPMVVENLLVTRHLFELVPEKVDRGFRSVSAVSPGVLGITGIETGDIVKGIVERTKPDLVIAIDALASLSVERINSTIQIADTGISPGSGVGNKRVAINKDSLGVPVIAIGVPTVVDAVSITSDTIDYILNHLGNQMDVRNPFDKPSKNPENKEYFMGMVGTLGEQEKRQLIYEVLYPLGHNLMVTPKEVDIFMEDMANILANGLNIALHQEINNRNVGTYTH